VGGGGERVDGGLTVCVVEGDKIGKPRLALGPKMDGVDGIRSRGSTGNW